MNIRPTLFLIASGWMAACAQIPGLEDDAGAQLATSDYPTLLTYDQLSELDTDQTLGDTSAEALEARAALLRARAEKLRNSDPGSNG